MLTTLSIKNFALIEQLDITFSNHFSIITGETGAGKSILLGALGLVLGKRADLTSLKDKEKKCVIEAQFNIASYKLQDFFAKNDLDYEDITFIRREILPSGKSRAFINDSPVNLAELQILSDFLLDIHSQHQTHELSNEAYQIQILDAIAGHNTIINEYKTVLKTFKTTTKLLNQNTQSKIALSQEQEYNTFLLQELLSANLKSGEQLILEKEYEKLNNIEFIKENLDKSILIINEESIGVLQNLTQTKNAMQRIANLSDFFKEIYNRITSTIIELNDIVTEMNSESDKLINDPEALIATHQKLQTIYDLQKKHKVSSVEELLDIQQDLDSKLIVADGLDAAIKKLQQQQAQQITVLSQLSQKISQNRENAIPILLEKITQILVQLGMPNACFKITIHPSENFLDTGKDQIELLFSANKGTSFGLLKKVASGGEMSRIMLAVKSILASYSKLPTIIFDEIDTGVSGEIAHKMGDIMKNMSKKMQVFAITHLPQIAAKGDQHYKVFKTSTDQNTVSELKLLSPQERVVEIAEMLSGKDISESALNHAKALLL